MKQNMLEKANSFWQDTVEINTLLIATYLDPRIKNHQCLKVHKIVLIIALYESNCSITTIFTWRE